MIFNSKHLLLFAASIAGSVQGLSCCASLEARFPGQGKVASPATPQYISLNQYWSPTSQLEPNCIFSPSSASDVSIAIGLFVKQKCRFSVKSGGHTAIPGWADINNGISISLANLNTIKYDKTAQTVKIGSGLKWNQIYANLDLQGVTVMGGRSGDVGVGGFLLGGGFSYLSYANGWAADNVVSFEIVLASGVIVNANSRSYSDLYRALKGGSSNFGIVTGFTLRAYAISVVNAGTAIYNVSAVPQLLKASYDYAVSGADKDPKSHIIPAFVQIGAAPVLPAYTLFYSQATTPLTEPAVYKPFISIPAVLTTRTNRIGFSTIAAELGAGQPSGQRNHWVDFSILADADLFQRVYDLWTETSKPYTSIQGFQTAIAFQVVSKGMIAAGVRRGGNVFGLDQGSKRTVVVVNLLATWSNAKDDEATGRFVTTCRKKAVKLAKSKGLYDNFEYLNYADESQDPIGSYGAANVAFLRRVKKRYDPKNVFGTLLPGGFKIL